MFILEGYGDPRNLSRLGQDRLAALVTRTRGGNLGRASLATCDRS